MGQEQLLMLEMQRLRQLGSGLKNENEKLSDRLHQLEAENGKLTIELDGLRRRLALAIDTNEQLQQKLRSLPSDRLSSPGVRLPSPRRGRPPGGKGNVKSVQEFDKAVQESQGQQTPED